MHLYEVLKRPVVTEKTMIATDENNKVAFEVDMRANKLQVKQAVEKAFDVHVLDVNIVVMPAKTARRGQTDDAHPPRQVEEGCRDSGARRPHSAVRRRVRRGERHDLWRLRFIDRLRRDAAI